MYTYLLEHCIWCNFNSTLVIVRLAWHNSHCTSHNRAFEIRYIIDRNVRLFFSSIRAFYRHKACTEFIFYVCFIVVWDRLALLIFLNARHYSDVTMGAIASQITSLTIVYSTVYSDADQRKHQSSASLTFVWRNLRGRMPCKVWEEITYAFPNFNDCTVEMWEWKSNFIPQYMMTRVIIYPRWGMI